MPTKSRTVALSLQEPVFLSLLREHLGIVPWSASDKMQTKTGFVYFILVRKLFAFDLAGHTRSALVGSQSFFPELIKPPIFRSVYQRRSFFPTLDPT